MCLNCGCGAPDKRHQPTDITIQDVERAAKGSAMPVQKAVTNIKSTLDKMARSTSDQAQASASR